MVHSVCHLVAGCHLADGPGLGGLRDKRDRVAHDGLGWHRNAIAAIDPGGDGNRPAQLRAKVVHKSRGFLDHLRTGIKSGIL